VPAEGVPRDRADSMEAIRAARARLRAEREHLAAHPAREWADEVLRLRQMVDEQGGTRAQVRVDEPHVIAVLVTQMGGTARVTALELAEADGSVLAWGRDDCGGFVFAMPDLA